MPLIGYWIEDLRDDTLCAPQELVGPLPDDVQSRLADYLDAGRSTPFGALGFSWCRFLCGAPPEEMGSQELTDGRWLWPQGLSHYVRKHGIILPDEFSSHATKGDALARLQAFTRRYEGLVADLIRLGDESSRTQMSALVEQWLPRDFWHEWCARHRHPKFLERLHRARAEADARFPLIKQAAMARRISQEIARHGLGDEECLFAGCKERVLTGKKFCARHIQGDDGCDPAGFYTVTPVLKEFMEADMDSPGRCLP